MNKTEIAQALVDMVEGRTAPADWAAWWQQHSAVVLALLNPGQALRLRMSAATPASHRALAGSQTAAHGILTDWQIPFVADPQLAVRAREELEAEIRALKAQADERRKKLQPRVKAFAARFPDFAKLLKRRFEDLEEIGPPASEDEIAALERSLPCAFPEDLREFLRCARSVRIGDTFHFDLSTTIRVLEFDRLAPADRPPSHGMLSVAELWWQADGDHLVLDVRGGAAPPFPAFYFSHETQPPSIRPVAPDFAGLLAWLSQTRQIWAS